MRKFLAASAFMAALGFVTVHQSDAQTIGFKVGPTFSKIALDPDSVGSNKTLTSFGGGGFIRFGAAGLNLQVEVLALTKGSKIENDPEFQGTGKLKLSYLEVPVNVMFKLGNGPYIFGGPTVAFETSCKVSAEFQGASFSASCDQNDPNADTFARHTTDFGVAGGAGLQFALGPGSVLVEGRYTHGLTNLNDDPNDQTKIRNRSFAVFGGYAISIGRR